MSTVKVVRSDSIFSSSMCHKALTHLPFRYSGILLTVANIYIFDGSLPSNLFTLVTTLLTHKHTSDICNAYKPCTKKNNKKKEKKKWTKISIKIVRYVQGLKESGAKKQQHSNHL